MNMPNRYGSFSPSVKIQRTKFDLSHSHKTTFCAGDLIPLYVQEVIPGSTYSFDMSSLVRQQTQVVPVMDDAYFEAHAWFVPTRIVWDHTKEFYGEVDPSSVLNPPQYSIPQLSFPSNGFGQGSLADYMGIPVDVITSASATVNALPFRAYAEIWNYNYRDQNIMQPAVVDKGDAITTGKHYVRTSKEHDDPIDLALHATKGYAPLRVCRAPDYFSTATPWPQKGNPVSIASSVTGSILNPNMSVYVTGEDLLTGSILMDGTTSDGKLTLGQYFSGTFADVNSINGSFAGLGTVNDIRLAFSAQAMLERDLFGTRFNEYIRNHFGVTTGDSRIQVPEYLGGYTMHIGSQQVVQTSETSATPLGTLAAYSLSTKKGHLFTHSFVEPGYLIVTGFVRTTHCYANNLERFWTRKDKLDFYDPAMAFIGNQPIYKRELYCKENTSFTANEWNAIWGYTEAWNDYRYKPNRVSGLMRPGRNKTGSLEDLSVFGYIDDYNTIPSLSTQWLSESPALIDNTVAIQSLESDQFIADFYFKIDATLPMPLYSIPGLVDHF